MSKLVEFSGRKNFQRFNNLKPDEKLIAHWALSFKELMKFNFSSFYGYDLDNIELTNQIRCTSSDKKGGINYFNYMYSDQYDDKDKKTDDKGKIYAVLSVYEALEKYCKTAGDWPGVVCLLGKWYEKNIHTYQGASEKPWKSRKFYECPLFKSQLASNGVGDDCTCFCFACIQLYWDLCMKDTDPVTHKKLMDYGWPPTSISWGNPDNQHAKNMEEYGFEILDYSPDKLQPWDMVMGSKDAGASHGHGEVYVGPYNGRIVEFGWGSIHDGQGHSGMPAGASYKEGEYSLIFRINGLKKYTEKEVKEIIDKYK